MKNVLIITSILFSIAYLASCSSSKEASPAEKPIDEAQAEKAPKPKFTSSSSALSPMLPASKFPFVDSAIVSIQHTSCYGQCPTYKVVIHEKGMAYFDGIRFAKYEGMHFAQFTQEEIASIFSKAKEIGFYEMEDKYDSNVSDFPSTYTFVRDERTAKLVMNRHRGPAKLKELESFIDDLIMTKTWVKKQD